MTFHSPLWGWGKNHIFKNCPSTRGKRVNVFPIKSMFSSRLWRWKKTRIVVSSPSHSRVQTDLVPRWWNELPHAAESSEPPPHHRVCFRCLRMNRVRLQDPVLQQACDRSVVQYQDLGLPQELTVWVDPGEVSCRSDPSHTGGWKLHMFKSFIKMLQIEPKLCCSLTQLRVTGCSLRLFQTSYDYIIWALIHRNQRTVCQYLVWFCPCLHTAVFDILTCVQNKRMTSNELLRGLIATG